MDVRFSGKKMRKAASIIMAASLVFTMMPDMGLKKVMADSEFVKTADNTFLGTEIIKNPSEVTNESTAWSGSYVYYGKYDGTDPTRYRVLANNTTDFTSSDAPTMLLDCDTLLFSNTFGASNVWANSSVRTKLNGDGFLTKAGNLSEVENSAIAESSKSKLASGDRPQYLDAGFTVLNNDKVFLLDNYEVGRYSYGYGKESLLIKDGKRWWLRTAADTGRVCIVNTDGNVSKLNANTSSSVYVSPAFNVDLSSVLFSSVISGVAGEADAEYKLTLIDEGLKVSGSIASKADDKVTVAYALSDESDTSDATQISVLVLDKKYGTEGATVLQYDKLEIEGNIETEENGFFELDLPDDTDEYYIYIFAEDINSTEETDYASKPVRVTLPINTYVGTSGIKNPTDLIDEGNSWSGHFVYYGKYDGENPTKYRVLTTNTTDFTSEDEHTMLLDCDSLLYSTPFIEGEKAFYMETEDRIWKNSDVRAGLNSKDFFEKEGNLTPIEKSALAYSTKEKPADGDGPIIENLYGNPDGKVDFGELLGDRVFILDVVEATRNSYGYEAALDRIKYGDLGTSWWIRSVVPEYFSTLILVNYDGSIADLDPALYSNIYVSPAFNVDLSSILLTTLVKGEAGKAGAEFKLTLLDKGLKVSSLTEAELENGIVTVPYTLDTESAESKPNQISVMVLDKAEFNSEAKVLQYEKLAIDGDIGTEGVGTFKLDLPDGIEDYHAFIIAEDTENSNRTDYASEPIEITIQEKEDDEPENKHPSEDKIEELSSGENPYGSNSHVSMGVAKDDTSSGVKVEGISIDNLKNFLTEEELKQAAIDGNDIKVWMDVSSVDESTITTEDKEKIDSMVSGLSAKVVSFFDFTIWKKIGSLLDTISEMKGGSEVTITVAVPAGIPAPEEGYERKYYFIRLHNGKAEVLDVSYDPAKEELSATSGLFSTYILAYTDSKKTDPGKDDSDKNSEEDKKDDKKDNSSNETPAAAKEEVRYAAKQKISIGSVMTIQNNGGAKIKYTSSDKKLAKVNKKGVITIGKNAGTVTITAKNKKTGEVLGSCTLNIDKPSISQKKVTVTGINSTINSYDYLQNTNIKPKWRSSNAEVATVDPQTGIVTTHKSGKAKIYAVFGGDTETSVYGTGKAYKYKLVVSK